MSPTSSSAELLALDDYLDALGDDLRVVPDALDPALAELADMLGDLPESGWADDLMPETLLERLAPDFGTPAVPPPGATGVPKLRTIRRRREGRRRPVPRAGTRRPAAALAVATVAMAVVALVATVLTTVGPPGSHPGTGPTARSWSLSGTIDVPGWGVSTGNGALDRLTCTTTAFCLATEADASPVVALSRDAGATWASVSLPAGDIVSSGFSCPSAGQCAVGATVGPTLRTPVGGGGPPVLLETVDGGQTWSSAALPAGVGAVEWLSCPTLEVCAGAGYPSSTTPGAPDVAFATVDGGSSWTVSDLAASAQPFGVDCPTVSSCVLFGESNVVGGVGVVALDLASSDGGRTWVAGSLPGDLASLVSVSCVSRSDCTSIGQTTGGPPVGNIRHWSGGPVSASVALTSHDGGASWTELPGIGLPGALLRSVSCPAAGTCVAEGDLLTAPLPGTVSTVVVTETSDGGSTWTSATLPKKASAADRARTDLGLTYLVLSGPVSCSAVGSCVALATESGLTKEWTVVLTNPGSRSR